MSDAELAMLFTEYYAAMEVHYINYISVIFAFLVASFLAAKKLHKLLAYVVIGLFTVFSLDSITVLYFFNQDVVSIQTMMHERVAAGSIDLAWHGGARQDFNINDAKIFVYSRIVVSVAGYLSSIVFFILCRTTK